MAWLGQPFAAMPPVYGMAQGGMGARLAGAGGFRPSGTLTSTTGSGTGSGTGSNTNAGWSTVNNAVDEAGSTIRTGLTQETQREADRLGAQTDQRVAEINAQRDIELARIRANAPRDTGSGSGGGGAGSGGAMLMVGLAAVAFLMMRK